MLHIKQGLHPRKVFLVAILLPALCLISCAPQTPYLSKTEPAVLPTLSTSAETIPTATNPPPAMEAATPVSLFGVEALRIEPVMLDQLDELGVRLVRRNGLLWSKVEPSPGERNWEAVADLEEGLELLGSRGFQTILIVRSTPEWAQKVPGYSCGAIKRKELEAFARFMQDAVSRYSLPPYNIKYWELGNEPDVDPTLVPAHSPFGCWGDQADAYYGGEFYARMLKVVYPVIKAADPQAQVLIGGLLLDCDPANPPEGSDCKPARFLEGILKAGGGDFFDIVSFHGYPVYVGSLEADERNPKWAPRGGAVLGRVAYLRELMAAYGVSKPLMHTESSLICPDWNVEYCNPPSEAFYEAQADYAIILFVRNWAAGVAGTIWYQFEGPGWRYSGLLDAQGAPKPVYRALQFLGQKLSNAQYNGPIEEYPAVRGYSFSTPEKRIWVLWSPDAQADTLILPSAVEQVLDKYGRPVQVEDGRLNVLSPVYVEFTP